MGHHQISPCPRSAPVPVRLCPGVSAGPLMAYLKLGPQCLVQLGNGGSLDIHLLLALSCQCLQAEMQIRAGRGQWWWVGQPSTVPGTKPLLGMPLGPW